MSKKDYANPEESLLVKEAEGAPGSGKGLEKQRSAQEGEIVRKGSGNTSPVELPVTDTGNGKELDQKVGDLVLLLNPELDRNDMPAIRRFFVENMASLIEELKAIKSAETVLERQIEADPRLGVLLERIVAGDEPQAAFREAGIDSVGQPRIGYYSRVNPFIDTMEENRKVIVRQLQKEGISAPRIDAFLLFAEETVNNLVMQEIDPVFLKELWKCFDAENAIEKARKEGIVTGRNMQIENRRNERHSVDGLLAPAPGSTVGNGTEKLGYIERILNSQY